jgi:hypothetical protein
LGAPRKSCRGRDAGTAHRFGDALREFFCKGRDTRSTRGMLNELDALDEYALGSSKSLGISAGLFVTSEEQNVCLIECNCAINLREHGPQQGNIRLKNHHKSGPPKPLAKLHHVIAKPKSKHDDDSTIAEVGGISEIDCLRAWLMTRGECAAIEGRHPRAIRSNAPLDLSGCRSSDRVRNIKIPLPK